MGEEEKEKVNKGEGSNRVGARIPPLKDSPDSTIRLPKSENLIKEKVNKEDLAQYSSEEGSNCEGKKEFGSKIPNGDGNERWKIETEEFDEEGPLCDDDLVSGGFGSNVGVVVCGEGGDRDEVCGDDVGVVVGGEGGNGVSDGVALYGGLSLPEEV